MPTYDYRCNACEHAFELFQSMTEARKRKCPSCGKNALERLIGTGAAVMFKGSGFYETDYRSESYKKAAKADGEGGGSATPAEKKPAASESAPAKAEPTPAKADPKPAKSPAKAAVAKDA